MHLPTKLLTFYPTLCRSFNKSIYLCSFLTLPYKLCYASDSLSLSLFMLFFSTHSWKATNKTFDEIWVAFCALINATIIQAQIFYTLFLCYAYDHLQQIIYDQILKKNPSHIVKIFQLISILLGYNLCQFLPLTKTSS